MEERSRYTVLVVDDEPTVRVMLAEMLDTYGFSTRLARDGREALGHLLQHMADIDLVLMDVVMPVLGGVDTLREIRKRGWDIPVLLMSGFTADAPIQEARHLNLAGFLYKPFSLEELHHCVLQALSLEAGGGYTP